MPFAKSTEDPAMKLSMFALLLVLPLTAVANSDLDIGSWHFTSGKITLDVEGGTPPEYGSLISIKSTDGEDDQALFQVSCTKTGYHLYMMYSGDDPRTAASGKARIHIDIDNNYWAEGDAKIIDAGGFKNGQHLLFAMSDVPARNLEPLMKTRTALKITVTGSRPWRFIANRTKDALLALHDAC
jgi:hypothetical protein